MANQRVVQVETDKVGGDSVAEVRRNAAPVDDIHLDGQIAFAEGGIEGGEHRGGNELFSPETQIEKGNPRLDRGTNQLTRLERG